MRLEILFHLMITQIFKLLLGKQLKSFTPLYGVFFIKDPHIFFSFRAWTGFKAQKRRGNREGYDHSVNRIDPMSVEGERRDQFPKMNLYQGFIGDNYPLCEDLPEKSFLRKVSFKLFE